MTEDKMKAQIVDIVKKEYQMHMVNLFEGNVSARMEEPRVGDAFSGQQGRDDGGYANRDGSLRAYSEVSGGFSSFV